MTYSVITWISTGYSGSPGYTKFKFNGILDAGTAATAATNSRSVLSAIAAAGIPSICSYACQANFQVYTDAGVLSNEGAFTPPSGVTGAQSGSYVGGAGAVIYWLTGQINGGHKVKGRTFIVPLAAAAYQNDGTLASAIVTSLQTAASTFATSTPQPVVNSRKLGQADRIDATFNISGAQVKDRSAFLRSRRT